MSTQHNPALNADQAKKILQSPEGKQLIALLNRDGGAAMRKAAAALKTGDQAAAQQAVSPLLQDPKAAQLLEKLTGKKG